MAVSRSCSSLSRDHLVLFVSTVKASRGQRISGGGELTDTLFALIQGRVFELGTPEFDALLPPGDERRLPGSRSIVWVDIQ
jgi:hypothetical protein